MTVPSALPLPSISYEKQCVHIDDRGIVVTTVHDIRYDFARGYWYGFIMLKNEWTAYFSVEVYGWSNSTNQPNIVLWRQLGQP